MDTEYAATGETRRWIQAAREVRAGLVTKGQAILGLQIGIVLACYSVTIIAGGYSWVWIAILTILVPTLLLIGRSTARQYRAHTNPVTAAGNPACDVHLAERIVAGELDGNELYRHTPWPFRFLVRPLPRPTASNTVARVVFAIEWYCGPPRRFLPQLWICIPALAAIILAAWFLVWLFRVPGMTVLENLWLGIFLLSFINMADPELDAVDMLEREFRKLKANGPPTVDPKGRIPSLILPAINFLAQNTGRIQFCFLRPCSLFPMITCVVLMFAGVPVVKPYLLVIIPLMMLTCTSSPIFIQGIARNGTRSQGFRRRVRDRLAGSDLPVVVVSGEVSQRLEMLNVPAVFKRLLPLPTPPQGYGNELVTDIWRACNNLDWLLDPPRVAIRGWWIALVVQALCLAAAISGAVLARMSTGPEQVTALVVCITSLVAVFLLAIPGWVHDGRMIIWREELLEVLRGSLRL